MVTALYILFFAELILANIYICFGIRNREGIYRMLVSSGALIINIAIIAILAYCKMTIIWFCVSGIIFLCLTLRDTYEIGYHIGKYDGYEEGIDAARAAFDNIDPEEIVAKISECLRISADEEDDDQP